MTKARGLIIVGLLLCAKPTFAGPLSFESGDLTGWMSLGIVDVVGRIFLPPASDLPPGTSPEEIVPTDALYQAVLTSAGASAQSLEGFFGLTSGFLTSKGYSQGAGLARNFTLAAGDTWTFDWNFATPDFFGDAAWFVMDSTGTLIVEDGEVAISGRVTTGYHPYSFTATRADTYLIGVGVFAKDNSFNSYLAVDNFNVVPLAGQEPVTVPEPATLLMLTVGWGTAFFSRRFFGAS